jgi:MFS family permease
VAAITENPYGVLATLRVTPISVQYLLGGVLVNQMGAFVQTFMVLYLILQGFSARQAGVTLAVYSMGALLGTLLGGELTDRIGCRKTIMLAMTTSALFLGFLPLLSDPALFGFLLVAVGMAGLATQSHRPAAAVLLSDLMPGELRVMGFSMMRIALNIGAALAALIASALILINWNLLFWFDAVTALVYALLALLLLPEGRRSCEEEKPVEEVRSAYAVLLRDHKYLLFLASVLLGSMIYVQYTAVLPLKITAEGHPPGLYSAMLIMSSVLLVACELKITTYTRRWPACVATAGGTAAMGVGVAGYGISASSSVLIVLSTIMFVFGMMVNGPTMFTYPATFPAWLKAQYIGATLAMFGLGIALGPIFGVLAWETLGNGVWSLCGALGVIAALCALLGMKSKAPAPL